MRWFPDWSSDGCIVVAGGPSAKDAPLELARGRLKVLVINDAYRLVPWADVLYACDIAWWRRHSGVQDFAGLKVTQHERALDAEWNVQRVRADRSRSDFIRRPLGRIAWGGHSGFQAINLVLQFGAKRILLVGFDMHSKQGVHWNGPHEGGLRNPSPARLEHWRQGLDATAPSLKAMGIEVLNCSAGSSLEAFPKASLVEALG